MKSKQDRFEIAIQCNDLETFKSLLHHENVSVTNDGNNGHWCLLAAVSGKSYKILEILLKDGRLNPAQNDSHCFKEAIKNSDHKSVKILLNDSRIDPSIENNFAIIKAYEHNAYPIIETLWNDQRVKNTLKNDYIELYSILVKKDITEKLQDF